MRISLLVILACGLLMLTGCGGGGSDSGTTQSSLGGNQVLLGSIAGAEIKAYRLSDLNNPIEGPIVSNRDATDLNLAGTFDLALTGVPDDEWILVSATGGVDIDADDNGVLDASPTPLNGTVYALATASQWKEGGVNISPLTDIAWRYSQDVLDNPSELSTRLDKLSYMALISQDINDDGIIDRNDLIDFHPLDHSQKLKFSFDIIQPDRDDTSDKHIECLLKGRSDTVIKEELVSLFGEYPWLTSLCVKCPACGKEFDGQNHIAVAENENLFRIKCPSCGYEFEVNKEDPPIEGTLGTVLEVLEGAGYTYVNIDTGLETFWAATPTFPVNINSYVSVPDGMPMINYFSKTLNRTFEEVFFVDSIYIVSSATQCYSSQGLQRIFFDPDEFSLNATAREILAQNASYLIANPTINVQIQGHTDEIGSDEENLALGESRAVGTKNYLVSLGISADRFSLISYGEEMPLDLRGTPEAHAINNRVEFKALR